MIDVGFSIFRRVTGADYLSLSAALLGFASILLVILNYELLAVVALVLAAIADYVDGRMARSLGGGHEWGKNVDSLCDVAAFGIAPAFLSWFIIINGLMDFSLTLALVAGFVFPALLIVGGILRLARYNVSTMHRLYVGMPITMNGVIFPIVWAATLWLTAELRAIAIMLTCVVSFALMVNDFIIRKR